MRLKRPVAIAGGMGARGPHERIATLPANATVCD